jgi:murein DD-endopeptidase MepM/ murein hydrolase activator NlpD
MRSAGDDGVVDPRAHPDTGADDRRERSGSFDPGVETGYLRRAPRERELSPELGAAPFDPGSAGYDHRRARREAKRRARLERRLLERAERVDRKVAASPAAGAGQAAAAARQLEAEPEPVQPQPARESATAEPEPAQVVELRPTRPPRESMAERLERQRIARERAEAERRARIEQERAAWERAERERRETRRRARSERPQRPKEAKPPAPGRAQVHPTVRGPVRKRTRAAENRRRAAARRHGLFWPTAKAGFAVSVVLALSAALGSLVGLPVPWVESGSGGQSLANSAAIFGVDAGTPAGLSSGYVFPLIGGYDFGDKEARFGASRYGHVHEGQDVFGKPGEQEVAVHDGVVVDRGKNSDPDSGGRGNYVVIYSPQDNHSFVYMHMRKPSPDLVGQRVHAGEVIGQLGCTGSCDGPHLHFEVRIGKASLGADTKPVDPLPYLRGWPQATPG